MYDADGGFGSGFDGPENHLGPHRAIGGNFIDQRNANPGLHQCAGDVDLLHFDGRAQNDISIT
ncbi:hypothetical protein D3C78_1822490 [compost metagenome]